MAKQARDAAGWSMTAISACRIEAFLPARAGDGRTVPVITRS
jgi:hypothetical protein